MKRQGLENILEKPKEIFTAKFRLYGEDEVVLTEEFETAEEKDQWYEAFGKWLEIEEGGVVEFGVRVEDNKK